MIILNIEQFKQKYLDENKYGIFQSELSTNGNMYVTLIDYLTRWHIFTVKIEEEQKSKIYKLIMEHQRITKNQEIES